MFCFYSLKLDDIFSWNPKIKLQRDDHHFLDTSLKGNSLITGLSW